MSIRGLLDSVVVVSASVTYREQKGVSLNFGTCRLKIQFAVISFYKLFRHHGRIRPKVGADPFVTWRQFTEQRLEPGETVEVYLADLRKLAAPFGGVTNRILGCTFLAGLPDDASWLL